MTDQQWRLVPVEPGDESRDMLEAAIVAVGQLNGGSDIIEKDAFWIALLSAAPSPPEDDVERVFEAIWRCGFAPNEDPAIIEQKKTEWPEDVAAAYKCARAALSALRPQTETRPALDKLLAEDAGDWDVEAINTNDLRDYADRIENPYAQLILDAAHQLDVARTDRNILDGLVVDLTERLKAKTAPVALSEEERAQLRTIMEEILGYAGHDAPWLKNRATEALSLIDKLAGK